MIFFFFFWVRRFVMIIIVVNCQQMLYSCIHIYFGYGDFEVLRLFGSKKKRWKVREERKRSVPL